MEDWAISSENVMVDLCDLAPYTIGAFLGNGSSGYGNNTYVTEISSPDVEVVERCLMEINIVFNKHHKVITRKPKREGRQTIYLARAYCKEVFDYFNSLTYHKQEVPIGIIQSKFCSQKDFIAGLFDTDGTVKFTETWNGSHIDKNPRWQLGFSNTKKVIIESAAAMLQKRGVRVGSINEYTKAGYITCYNIFPNIKDFIAKGFYFHSKRKHARLQDYLNHVVGSETLYTASITMDEDKVQQ